MKVSIVILNWNGKELLRECMPSVVKAALATNETYEIIVVDNGSVDGSVDFLKSKYPKVRIVPLRENVGFVEGSNAGARAANGDIIVFANNDIEMKSDSIKYLIPHFSDNNVFGVSPKLMKFDKKTIQAEFIGLEFVLGTVVQTQPNTGMSDKNQFKNPVKTFFASGGASAMDRKKFLQLGGFDEAYSPFYFEEHDLSYRAYKRGWTCIYEPRSIFYHKHRATLGKAFTKEQLQIQELKGRFVFTWSNFSDPVILLKHLAFLPIVFARSAFVSQYRSGRFLDVRAFFAAISMWGDILRKRADNAKHSKLSDREVIELINSNHANELSPVKVTKFFKK